MQIRKATIDDIPLMHSWIEQQAVTAKLLPMPPQVLKQKIDQFLVLEGETEIIGCGALDIYNENLAEIRTLVISQNCQAKGGGRLLVNALEQKAREMNIRRIMALTFVPGFFEKLGYRVTDRAELPEKIWRICLRCPKFFLCDEIAVVKELHN